MASTFSRIIRWISSQIVKHSSFIKKYIFQADPFIIDKDDRLYVFYEAFSFLNSKGVLRCRILNNALEEIEDLKLEGFDDLKCHLSFPFLFQLDGKLFMIPESSERKEVILFQSVDFPARWGKGQSAGLRHGRHG
ncbi:Uncharacterised protein [Leclercia adecarboxylata]|uniref:Glucosamine inositolphosphorylceramide transferase 1 N-terminal domain-containing protein n=1 Tax=Leclercia adecarboxylata TaxID=83655 RepID=A0A4U9HGG0_9ENTR|nr:Uncharacterised protein [Leclercia adecarboxylata]